jgi:hypothetical protein
MCRDELRSKRHSTKQLLTSCLSWAYEILGEPDSAQAASLSWSQARRLLGVQFPIAQLAKDCDDFNVVSTCMQAPYRH